MPRRLAYFIVPTLGLALLDLAVKERLPTSEWLLHERSAAWVALSTALLLGCVAIACLSSRTVAVMAALTAGGALGNLVSVAQTAIQTRCTSADRTGSRSTSPTSSSWAACCCSSSR